MHNYPNAFYVDKNPGDYIVKVYRNGVQVRESSFTVGADGASSMRDITNRDI